MDERGERRAVEAGGGGGGTPRAWAVLVRVDLKAGLRGVPVVGDLVPVDADVRLEALSAAAMSQGQGPDEVRNLNEALARIGSGDLLVPTGLKSRVALGVTASLAGRREDLWAMRSASGRSLTATDGHPRDGTAGAIVWVPVGRGLGPVRLERLGVQYKAPPATVWVLADASVELAGLTFAADGMGLGIPVKDPAHVTARLDGLGLAWDRPPLKVAGSFLLRDKPGYSVMIDGAAAVETPALALVAVGGYAQKIGEGPSVFVFGRLALKNGQGVGPPPFRITGAAAGFGFNSTVRVPGAEEICDFPLMPAGADHLLSAPLAYLEKLTGATGSGRPWISPAPGRAWLAAGIDFDSFKFLKGSALALVDFGTGADKDFTLALLGHLEAEFPNSSQPFAKVGLDLAASYSSRTDMLGVFAKISPGSFVVHESCRLSGGAALCVWFGASAHPGDFVATVGGYHQDFSRPSHYPDVGRLELSWSVSDNVSMRGSCYAALTPAAFMVGTEVKVSFHAGPISAGCEVGIDALIQWDPFFFEVTAHADIWVELDVLFTLRGTFGVGVDFWGPPTGGIATVHALGCSFDISFGEDRPRKRPLLSWKEFTERRLHDPVVEVHPVTGLLPAGGTGEDAIWQMSHDAFSLTTRSAVPVTHARLRNGQEHRAPAGWKDSGPIPVRPVGLDAVTSTHTVEVTHNGQPYDVEKNRWQVDRITGPVPLGLWGTPLGDDEPSLPSGEETTEAVTGLRLTVPPAPQDDAGLATTEKTLAFEDTDGPVLALPVRASPVPAAVERPGVRAMIAADVAGAGATGRTALVDQLAQWGLAPTSQGQPCPQDALCEYSDHLWVYLRSEPLLCQDKKGAS
ncbi:DUF6603 domain-containing protein [Streptomyces sp. MMBL 11-1]|uniref:DUF6603 domain-containing protein n=1 Tax=Streptomyces sp. MMBL 11-1 TaxID=3026420 RepID=UPI002363138A|nr:DUF6603 domain-containing protein [Streptomyces sp. MMBL 11-1]